MKERAVLFVLLFVSFAYFYQAGGWNQNSRFALVRAITNEGTLNIDPFRHSTGDIAFHDGHYYSDKAPGLALTAVPLVAAARPIYHAFGGDAETYEGLALLSYLATVVSAGLFTALAGVCLFTLCLELGSSYGGALFAALTFTIASPIWTLATIFIGHAFAASLLVLAFAAAMRIGADEVRPKPDTTHETTHGAGDATYVVSGFSRTRAYVASGFSRTLSSRDVRLGAMVGFCAGWATVSEFPAAIPAVLLALLAAANAWPLGRARALRILGALTASALACAAVLMAYQYACFGSPFHVAYASEIGYEGMQQGVFGVTLPRMIRLRRILFGEYRGLLPLAPALALAPIGLAVMVWVRPKPDATYDTRSTHDLRSRRRVAAVVSAVIGVYFILLNASYNYWEGGWSYGPRHAAPGIPFLCVSLAFLWTAVPAAGRWILGGLCAYGAAVTLIAVSTMPLPPGDIRRPVAEFMWPAFRDGDLSLNTQTFVSYGVNLDFRGHHEPRAAFNLGMKLGLSGHASLVPLAVVWLGCGFVLISSARGSARTARTAPGATKAPPRSPESPTRS